MARIEETRSRPLGDENSSAAEGPVVVIEYRHRGLSWALLVPLLLVACTGAILIYHRVVAERYRREAARARADYESLRKSQAAVLQTAGRPTAEATPTPLAENSMPILKPVKPAVAEPAKSQPEKPAPPQPVVIVMAPNPAAAKPPEPAAERTRPLSPMGKPLPRPGEPAAAPPSPKPADEPKPALAAAPLAPLPSKEEALRAIQQESAELKAKLAQGWQEREISKHETFLAEQVRFRTELREALRGDPRETGSKIDALAKRHEYGVAPGQYRRAEMVWGSRRSLRERVASIRAMTLPETVILNMISNDLHRQVRTRDGPRDENEVRVRAARLLLSYDYPSEPKTSPSQGPAGASNAPADAATRPIERRAGGA